MIKEQFGLSVSSCMTGTNMFVSILEWFQACVRTNSLSGTNNIGKEWEAVFCPYWIFISLFSTRMPYFDRVKQSNFHSQLIAFLEDYKIKVELLRTNVLSSFRNSHPTRQRSSIVNVEQSRYTPCDAIGPIAGLFGDLVHW